MIAFKNLQLRRGGRIILDDANIVIHSGQKVGLTGANGAGKSSLFAMLLGKLEPEAGSLDVPDALRISHVAQETPADSRAAVEYVMDGDAELRRIQHELVEAEESGDGELMASLHSELEEVDGYTAENRALQLLAGLGFSTDKAIRSVDSFSGGWRMRLNLAQALMCPSDLLLLDEPTNHLDLDAVFWLQEWLKKYPGTLILISHDREFLDALTDVILHIENKVITSYTGNYSSFERARAERLAQQQAAHEKQVREMAHIQSFVDRFRAKATKAKQAQSRLKALQRIEQIAAAHVDSPFHFEFREPEKNPELLVSMGNIELGYSDQCLLNNIRLTLIRGDRIALIGPNGAGKSTLIKYLAGEMQELSGERTNAEYLRIGYFAQHQLEQLRFAESPLQHLQSIAPKATESELRSFLGGFGFIGDAALGPVEPFSGGEKARLVLAMLVYQKPNLLLLDEPTNHLDMDMRHALSIALQDFAGAVVVVSHDRHFLRTVSDRLVLVIDGGVTEFDGDLDDYRRLLADYTKRASGAKDDVTLAGSSANIQGDNPSVLTVNAEDSKRQQRKRDADIRKQVKPYRDKAVKLERELEKLHQQQSEFEEKMSDLSLYEDARKEDLLALTREKAELDAAVEQCEEAWLEAQDIVETMQGGA